MVEAPGAGCASWGAGKESMKTQVVCGRQPAIVHDQQLFTEQGCMEAVLGGVRERICYV